MLGSHGIHDNKNNIGKFFTQNFASKFRINELYNFLLIIIMDQDSN